MEYQNEIINTIKLLVYKENPSIFDKVDFDDDNIFLEPLLFTYFNSKKDNLFPAEMLEEILQGYFIEKDEIRIKHSYNKNGVAYIPNFGYYKNGENRSFEPIFKIKNISIELFKQPIKLLENVFRTRTDELINKEEIIIDNLLIEKNINALTNAFKLIKKNSPEQFKLIEENCKKVLLFKTNPENTNSFATINAHGIAFLNVYQDNYNVVFFIDDLAHQTGHIILTTLFHDRKSIFKTDENLNIGEIIGNKDYRSFYTLIHALYTYYTTFLCLDACLNSNSFNSLETKEAIGRIGFYLMKCKMDLNNFNKYITHHKGIENVLTESGIEIFNTIKKEYANINNKWYPITSKLNYYNQPYNFTFDIFVENNKTNL